MLKRENQMDKEKLSTLENTLFEQQEIICILKEQNLTIKSKLLSIENFLSMQSCQSQANPEYFFGDTRVILYTGNSEKVVARKYKKLHLNFKILCDGLQM